MAGKLYMSLGRGHGREVEKAMPFAMEVGQQLHGRSGRLQRKNSRKLRVPEDAGLGLSQDPKDKVTEKEEA